MVSNKSVNISGISGSSITINGETYKGNSIKIVNGVVTVGDQTFSPEGKVIINIIGNVGYVETASGDVSVKGEVTRVSTVSGDVECGAVSLDVSTVSGDVYCDNVSGNVTTISGDIIRA